MKKIVAIFFLLIYSLTTVGATIHTHYCMGEFVGSSLYHSNAEKCNSCGMKASKSKGCCKDEHKYVSLKREHNQTKASAEILNFFTEAAVPVFITYNFVTVNYPTITANTTLHPPPLIHKQRLHLINCVFRI
jgi:hypothetical protein